MPELPETETIARDLDAIDAEVEVEVVRFKGQEGRGGGQVGLGEAQRQLGDVRLLAGEAGEALGAPQREVGDPAQQDHGLDAAVADHLRHRPAQTAGLTGGERLAGEAGQLGGGVVERGRGDFEDPLVKLGGQVMG